MKRLLSIAVASVVALTASAAFAGIAVIDGITVTDAGRVNPSVADQLQPGWTSSMGSVEERYGQTGAPQPNNGWDPFGQPTDTTHHWINIGSDNSSAMFAFYGDTLSMVWGSPNNDNAVSFYFGDSLIGAVTNSDLVSNFGVVNTPDPGYLISFKTPETFNRVVFSTDSSAFEFAFAAPEPTTWVMFLTGFVALGLVGRRSARPARAIA